MCPLSPLKFYFHLQDKVNASLSLSRDSLGLFLFFLFRAIETGAHAKRFIAVARRRKKREEENNS